MSTENLQNQEAKEKIKTMVDHIDISMFSTFCKESPFPYTVPMSRQEVDQDGNIWFLCSAESQTFKNIQKNNNASLNYAHVGEYQFLTLNGTVEISTSQERIDKYWNKFVEAWFEKGKEDPNIRILKVTPNEAHYWDNKTNKLMTLLKVAASAVTGSKMDIGREGSLDL